MDKLDWQKEINLSGRNLSKFPISPPKKIQCYYCGKEKPLSISLFGRGEMISGHVLSDELKAFCNEECYDKYLSETCVKEYRNHRIFSIKDEKHGVLFVPYIYSPYGFSTLKQCEDYIDVRLKELELGREEWLQKEERQKGK